MKIVKIILGSVAAALAVILIAGLFVRKDYAVQKEITIDRSRPEVFAFVKLLKNQDRYSVWAQLDPAMKKEYRGTDGTVGFVSGWHSQNENVGRGEQEIIQIQEDKRLDFELRFFEPFEATDRAYMITEDAGEKKTRVIWGFEGSMPYPMNLMLLFMNMEEMLGGQLKTGLENLKRELEKN